MEVLGYLLVGAASDNWFGNGSPNSGGGPGRKLGGPRPPRPRSRTATG